MSIKTMIKLKECIPIFNMLQDESRQELLVMLFDNGPMTVTEIADNVVLSRPTVSHHLKLLLQANLISVEKKGKERIYDVELNNAVILLEELLNSIKNDIGR